MPKFCPFAKSDCICEACMFWNIESCLIVDYFRKFGDVKATFTLPNIDEGDEKVLSVPQELISMSLDDLALDIETYLNKNFKRHKPVDSFTQLSYLQSKGCEINSLMYLPKDFKEKLEGCCKTVQEKLSIQKEAKFGKEIGILRWLEESTEDQLAYELVEFLTNEFGGPQNQVGFSIARVDDYWRAKGVNTFDLSAELKNKITRVHTKAMGLLTKLQRENQLSKFDNYVYVCVKWAKQNDLKKISLAEIDSILNTEMNISLQSDIKRICQSKVNNLLQMR